MQKGFCLLCLIGAQNLQWLIFCLFYIFFQLGEGSGVKETPQQKYQRLVNEIQELVQEVDTIQVHC